MSPHSDRPDAKSPLSRPFAVDAHRDYPVDVEIEADKGERDALAAVLRIPAIAALGAALRIAKAPRGRFTVSGTVKARLTRMCVVSLDPFETNVEEPVEATFASPPEAEGKRRFAVTPEIVVGEGEEPPDPIVNGRIDLGALVGEFLAMGLDPHPRKPGVVFDEPALADEPPASPFEALARLSTRRTPDKT